VFDKEPPLSSLILRINNNIGKGEENWPERKRQQSDGRIRRIG
jgi:hypothetical protein